MTKSKRIFKKMKRQPPRRNALRQAPVAPPTTGEEIPEFSDPCTSGLTPMRDNQTSPPPTVSALSSSSEKKLFTSLQEYDDYSSLLSYDVVDIMYFGNCIADFATCRECHGDISFEVTSRVGIAMKAMMKCKSCNKKQYYDNCKRLKKVNSEGKLLQAYALNIRLVYSMRCIGKGLKAAQVLLAMMNLPPPPSKFGTYESMLSETTEDICKKSMAKSVVDAIEENEGVSDLTVAFDGTWQKRGHTSQNAVVTVISGNSDKIIDVEIMSKYCNCKGRLKNIHSSNCQANYIGTSGGMEVEGVKIIYNRSEVLYGAKYTTYLGDGDSKAYQAVINDNPYGPDVSIEKVECVGHVQKRMGARLRILIKKTTQKLVDNKPLGGKGRLTDSAIDKLQNYYWLAISRNVGNSLEQMRKAVWATFMHIISTDESPNHIFCPKGDDSWCGYWKAAERNEQYHNKDHFHLPPVVMSYIKPVFASLSHPDLLAKCLHGRTQNSNESFNNVLWSIIPKNVFVTLKVLKFGTYEAVLLFNRGNMSRVDVFKSIGIDPGLFCFQGLKKIDVERIRKGNLASLEATREGRLRRSRAKKSLEEHFEIDEGDSPSYAAGQH